MTGPRVITIDGPAGSGKSTVARALSGHTQIPYLSTGLLYRAVGLAATRAGVAPEVSDALDAFLASANIDLVVNADGSGFEVVLDGEVQPDSALRTEAVGAAASLFASLPPVRARLLELQRASSRQAGVIVEGRDTGSIVFPDADVKIFLSADPVQRARRRALELGLDPDDPEILADVQERDRRDTERAAAPLVVPEGAVEVDCTELSIEQTVAHLLTLLG